MRTFFPAFFIFLFTSAHALSPSDPRPGILSAGPWHGEIVRKDGHTIPFNFLVSDQGGKIKMVIVNGTERLMVDDIRQKGDSLFIHMPFFDAYFAVRITNREKLEGNWIRKSGTHRTLVPFRAIFNLTDRYPLTRPARFNISGRWSVHFKTIGDSTEAVGEFKQTGQRVTGTFLTITGDYRFLEGVVNGDTLKLSTFDGSHAYGFQSIIRDTGKMVNGFYYAGASSVETWVAEKNEGVRLPDEFSQTRLKDSAQKVLHFRFPDLQGKMVSLSDPAYQNKVVIIQILGSWCPNCMDETRFLGPWYRDNKSRGVEIIGLAYERTTSYPEIKKLLQPFIRTFGVSYPILVTGVLTSDSLRTEKTIPEIRQLVGFPTTIFIDKKGAIRKIHTGFNGPGTGDHYEQFKKEFNELVQTLLNE